MTKEGADALKDLESRVRRLEFALIFVAGLLGSGVVPEAIKAVFLK